MHVIWSLQHWAQAVAELPATGRLPQCIALVPNARVAHALRRELIETNKSGALIGTRFLTLLQLASEIVLEAGEPHLPNDRDLGPSFALDAFENIELERFNRSDLCQLPGWDIAFIRTLADLDAALLSPDACLGSDDPHVRDVGRMHQQLRGGSELLTMGAIIKRAAILTAGRPAGPATLAVLTGFESPAELSLLRALPTVTLAAWAMRPRRAALSTRFAALVGAPAPELDSGALLAVAPANALQHLQLRLFEDMPSTPAPRDASVTIALYAGVHEEVEAATSWVTEQIVEHGVAAQDIAILSAIAEPYGSMLRARLDAISSETEPAIATFSERGVPLVERADGIRLLLLLRALFHGLPREKLASLLPFIRLADEEQRIRGQAHAWEILNAVAAVGGTQSHLDAGTVWPEAWRRAIERLAPAPSTDAGREEREIQHRAEMHGLVSSLTSAIDALATVLAAVIGEEPLHLLWARIQDFVQAHLKLPFSAPPATAVLAGACRRVPGVGNAAREPTGVAALQWLDDNLCHLTVQDARFGTPAVYLGTLSGVRGLRFRAVRIIGLAEGSVPSAARQDPVLPDAARAQLSPFLLSSRQRAHRQLTTFDDAVRCASERLCLTAPRASVEGSIRQPAAVLLDVVKALEGSNVDLERKLEAAAADGRARERSARNEWPISKSAKLGRMALGDVSVACSDPSLSLDALRAIRDRTEISAQDGLLPGVLPLSKIPGLGPDRPISASRLKTLVSCPHRFLYEHILGFREAEEPPRAHRLEANTFGTWLHTIAEEFWQEHGAVLATRPGAYAEWNTKLRDFAQARFERLRPEYPFENDSVADAAVRMLFDQLGKLLAVDWNAKRKQQFIAVERRFGYAGECDINTDAGSLYFRGKIDKLDTVDDGTLLVRDIKTGSGKARTDGDEPEPDIDLQLALYALVAKRMARDWGTPEDVAVAYIYLRRGEQERSWRDADYARLEEKAKGWLATARETLETGAFARSPIEKDCEFCPYKPVCAPERHRAETTLNDPRVPQRLKLLKLPEGA